MLVVTYFYNRITSPRCSTYISLKIVGVGFGLLNTIGTQIHLIHRRVLLLVSTLVAKDVGEEARDSHSAEQ